MTTYTKAEARLIRDAFHQLGNALGTISSTGDQQLSAAAATERSEIRNTTLSYAVTIRAFLDGYDRDGMPAAELAAVRDGIVRATLLGIHTKRSRRAIPDAVEGTARDAVRVHDAAFRRTQDAASARQLQTTTCRVFLLCGNAATTTISNPVLGDVPACQRCADKMARLAAR